MPDVKSPNARSSVAGWAWVFTAIASMMLSTRESWEHLWWDFDPKFAVEHGLANYPRFVADIQMIELLWVGYLFAAVATFLHAFGVEERNGKISLFGGTIVGSFVCLSILEATRLFYHESSLRNPLDALNDFNDYSVVLAGGLAPVCGAAASIGLTKLLK